MFKHATIALAIAAAALTVTACNPATDDTTTTTRRTHPITTPGKWVAPTTVAPVATDPLSSNGTWLVPSEIAPGTYKATPTRPGRSGYYALCADLGCDIDFDGNDHTGMIDNDNLDGPGYIVIPDYAAAVELSNLTLTLIG